MPNLPDLAKRRRKHGRRRSILASQFIQLPIEYVSTPIYDGNKLAGAVVVFRNVTEHKRATEALRVSENFAETILHQRK